MGIRKKLKKVLPWWLTGREEHCAGCGQAHAHGVTVHCVACDQPFCPVCVVVVEGEAFCSSCHVEGDVR